MIDTSIKVSIIVLGLLASIWTLSGCTSVSRYRVSDELLKLELNHAIGICSKIYPSSLY